MNRIKLIRLSYLLKNKQNFIITGLNFNPYHFDDSIGLIDKDNDISLIALASLITKNKSIIKMEDASNKNLLKKD